LFHAVGDVATRFGFVASAKIGTSAIAPPFHSGARVAPFAERPADPREREHRRPEILETHRRVDDVRWHLETTGPVDHERHMDREQVDVEAVAERALGVPRRTASP